MSKIVVNTKQKKKPTTIRIRSGIKAGAVIPR